MCVIVVEFCVSNLHDSSVSNAVVLFCSLCLQDVLETDEQKEERFVKELVKEQKGDYTSEEKLSNAPSGESAPTSKDTQKYQQRRSKRKSDVLDEEERARVAESLLPKKRRRLLQRIEYSKKKKQEKIDKLKEKKLKLQNNSSKKDDEKK